jgi:hypothetical protein
VVPAWRITTLEGAFLILTRLDADKPEQRQHARELISRFMREGRRRSPQRKQPCWRASLARTASCQPSG